MKIEQVECSETSTYKIHMPENYPEESTQHSEHSGSLKSRIKLVACVNITAHCSESVAISVTSNNLQWVIFTSA